MCFKYLAFVVLASNAMALTAWAHHSHGAYAMTDYTEVTGTVTDVYWINPHAWVYLDVVGSDGQAANWALEAAGATTLARAGIDPDGLKTGDKISVRCHPLRDGSNGCLLGYVTTEDGSVVEWD
jgi:hypothetical protein